MHNTALVPLLFLKSSGCVLECWETPISQETFWFLYPSLLSSSINNQLNQLAYTDTVIKLLPVLWVFLYVHSKIHPLLIMYSKGVICTPVSQLVSSAVHSLYVPFEWLLIHLSIFLFQQIASYFFPANLKLKVRKTNVYVYILKGLCTQNTYVIGSPSSHSLNCTTWYISLASKSSLSNVLTCGVHGLISWIYTQHVQ